MIRQRASSARQTVLLLLCLAAATACSAQSSAGDTVYHLHGTVIDGITGKPLSRALVKSGDQRLATMTGTDGKFSIDISVPERPVNPAARTGYGSGSFTNFGGSVLLMAQKPGYLVLQNRLTPIAIGEALSSTPVEIKLMPAAIVTGHVSSAAADSAAGVRVNLLRHSVQDGHRFWTQAGTSTTNAHGDFRFPDLNPGEYALLTSQWAGEQPQPTQRGAITQQYPPTFYGDVRNLAGSTKLRLHYGDTTPTDIHLHLANYYPITVPVTTGSSSSPVNARLIGPENSSSGAVLRYNRTENAIEGSLPSGDYTLMLSNAVAGPQQLFAQLPLHVESEPVRTGAIALSPPASVQIHVHTEFTKQEGSGNGSMAISARLQSANSSRISVQPQLLQILLRSEDGNGGFSVSHPTPSGDLIIDNLQPGRYYVQEQIFRGYVSSMTSGGVDLRDHLLIVNASNPPDPIDVSLRDDTATLTGNVLPGDGPLPQMSFIVVLPTDSAGRYTQGFAGPDGKYAATNIPPGSYRVFAFRGQPVQLPYRDPEAMHHYDDKGIAITINASGSQQLDVPLLDPPEED